MGLRAALLATCLAGVAAAVVLGGTWSDRLADHEGYYLVPVRDAVAPAARAALAPPRRAVLVVVDGLGFDEASAMPVMAALRARGQCLRTYVGAFSVSQPVYAVLSTGLEQDRTGARNNEPPVSPLRAEPIWRVAREAGLSVSAISELDWWQRLFLDRRAGPGGDVFSRYVVRPRPEDYFAQAPPADLMLIHPVYVDEAGHEGGAASEGYRQAVARADREIGGLLRTLDLGRDLLVVTADHGHTLRGGHGGEQPRVTHVLTCLAGPGVRHTGELGELRSTTVAPALALLLGLRFPAHMRAGLRPHGDQPDDDLDSLWRIADPAALPAAYLSDRRAAVARFREENDRHLKGWPGAPSSWSELYAQQRQAQHRRALGALGALLALLALLSVCPARPAWPAWPDPAADPPDPAGPADRRRPARSAQRRLGPSLFCVAWLSAIYLALYLLTVALRGSFDATSVNQKGPFIRFGLELSAAVLVCAGLLHIRLRRSLAALRADMLALLCVTLALSVAHPLVYGWHLGFPIPPSELIYLPYFNALFLFVLSVLALPLCLPLRVAPQRRPEHRIPDGDSRTAA